MLNLLVVKPNTPVVPPMKSQQIRQQFNVNSLIFIVPGAGHVDLYDRVDLIPFAKLTSFFKDHLK
jgi:hypothetical protein